VEYRPAVINHILRDINRLYFLPAIQREFVWEPEKIEKLFDSIMGDYPIGSFLFWKIKEETKNDWTFYEFVKNFNKENPHSEPVESLGINKDFYLILDGQQRLTSLYIGLLGSYRYFRYRWRTTRLYLNIFKEPVPNEDDPEELTYQFKFWENDKIVSIDENELWYRVGRVLDFEDAEDAKADIKKYLSGLTEGQVDIANKLIGRLHARIHTVLVINYYEERSQDPDKVLNIFVRANSAGKTLEYSDLLLSTATAKWENLDARKEIHDFTDEINAIGYGYSFGKDFVLKGSLYLTEDLPIQYKVKNFNRPNLIMIENNWDNIKKYLRTTIRLVSKFGFSSKNIVAPIALLPIAFFIQKKKNENIDKSSEKNDSKIQMDIQRWLIFSLLKNAFGGSSDTKLKNIRDVLVALTNYTDYPMVKINEKLGIEMKISNQEIEDIIKYKYHAQYTFLALSLLYPDRYWKDVVLHEDHIFPKSEFKTRDLRKRGYDDATIFKYQTYYDTILNLQLITDSENLSKNSTPFDEWITTRDVGFKKMHLIPEMEDYSFDRFLEFIENRKAMIIEKLMEI
jgi:hypothetical protein